MLHGVPEEAEGQRGLGALFLESRFKLDDPGQVSSPLYVLFPSWERRRLLITTPAPWGCFEG